MVWYGTIHHIGAQWRQEEEEPTWGAADYSPIMSSNCCIFHTAESSVVCRKFDDGCHYYSSSSSNDNNEKAQQRIKMAIESGPHGVHAMASEDIPAGAVILQCLPLTLAPILHGPSKSTCSRCFFQEGDHDLSGKRKKEKLARCARCRVIYYCCRECQSSDWDEHKLECQYYVKRRKNNNPLSDKEADIPKPLLLRTFSRLKVLRDKTNSMNVTGISIIEGAVSCGPQHFSSLAVSPRRCETTVLLNSPEMNLVKSIMMQHAIGKDKQNDSSSDDQAAAVKIWGYDDGYDDNHQHNRVVSEETPKKKLFTLDQSILRADDAFKKNNFAIMDALHSAIGEGIYPCAALLNHSCNPNCILSFKLDNNELSKKTFHQPLLQIIACRDIVGGEELTHCYVDLMLSTKERQARLLKTHGFLCHCKRCVEGECLVLLPRDRTLWRNKWPLDQKLNLIAQEECHDQEDLIMVDLETALNECSLGDSDRDAILACSELLRDKANQCMLCDHVEEELNCLRSAVDLWQDNEEWFWTPFNLPLYSARSQYFTALLANEKIEEALDQLEFIVSTLIVAFSHVEHHPLLGLQLFTLGDLYAFRGGAWERKAYAAYAYAKNVMSITHGVDHPMVRQLGQRIAEHANAS